jgi:phosphoribosylcarboxyaminoimidazole (NCAIR) mutase
VAINNSTNAALLAIRILGSSVCGIQDKLVEYAAKQEEIVMGKIEDLKVKGWESY